jgi:uncharacterized protein
MDRASPNEPERSAIAAGTFPDWLDVTRDSLAREQPAGVPCGTCNACCRASQFIHIQPHETRSLARIPKQLLFPAPGLPRGHLLLGYDEQGRCPMLIEDRCSIYADRPHACRTYDCRVFAAAAVSAGDGSHPVERQVRRWRFALPSRQDEVALRAVQAAAAFLRSHSAAFPSGFLPRNPSQWAILAIKVFDVFVDREMPVEAEGVRALVDEVVAAHERFQRAMPAQSSAI